MREQVACKENISLDVLGILQNDDSLGLLRNLVRTSALRENVSQEYLEKIISLDAEIPQSIASNIDAFQNGDVNQLAALLIKKF